MMSHGLARRGLALAAVALLGGVLAFAAASWDRNSSGAAPQPAEQVSVPGAGWYDALAAPYPSTSKRERTACGQKLGPKMLGVAHPVLPCGVKLFIAYGDKVFLTQVVDRGPAVPGRDFDITRPLAARLGLKGTQQIRWRYAR
jgi:rare lipoprotein A (peptidoglycan hydrolase)